MPLHSLGKRCNACVIVRISFRRPPSRARPRPCNRLLSSVNSKRKFSTSPPAWNLSGDSDFLDDPDDDGGNGRRGRPVVPIGLMDQPSDVAQRQKNKQKGKARSAIRILAASEQSIRRTGMEETPRKPKTDSPRIADIELQLSSVCSRLDPLISKYCELKYSHLATIISQAAAQVQLLSGEYRAVAAGINQRLDSEAAWRKHENRWREMDSIEASVNSVLSKLTELGRLKDELLGPMISARRRVNSGLETGYGLQRELDHLHRSTSAVTEGLFELQRILKVQGSRSTNWLFVVLRKEFMMAAHKYRATFNARNVFESRFAESWPFMFFLAPVERLRFYKTISMIRWLHTMGKPLRDMPRHDDLDLLRPFYFPRSESQPSPLLDLHRRQLDVMALFVLVDSSGAALQQEVFFFLAKVLKRTTKGSWRSLGDRDLENHQIRLSTFSFHYMEQRAEFRGTSSTVWHINWMRLQAEDRLQRLGGWTATQGIGLIVAKPLTRDLIRFRQWVNKLRSYTERMRDLQRRSGASNPDLDEVGEPADLGHDGREHGGLAPLSAPELLDLGSGHPENVLSTDLHNHFEPGRTRLSKIFAQFDESNTPTPRKRTGARKSSTHKNSIHPVRQPGLRPNTLHPSTGKSHLWPKSPKLGSSEI